MLWRKTRKFNYSYIRLANIFVHDALKAFLRNFVNLFFLSQRSQRLMIPVYIVYITRFYFLVFVSFSLVIVKLQLRKESIPLLMQPILLILTFSCQP